MGVGAKNVMIAAAVSMLVAYGLDRFGRKSGDQGRYRVDSIASVLSMSSSILSIMAIVWIANR